MRPLLELVDVNGHLLNCLHLSSQCPSVSGDTERLDYSRFGLNLALITVSYSANKGNLQTPAAVLDLWTLI